jgi:hypothetical protein
MNIAPLNRWIPGALSKRQLKQLCRPGWIEDVTLANDPIDYSAVDLTLSAEGYQMLEGCIKPFGQKRTLLAS